MHRSLSISRTLLATASALLVGVSAGAQCQLEWRPGPAAAGPLGLVNSLAEAANGDLLAAGYFRIAGSQVVNNIARYDGSDWQAIGGGINGTVKDVVVLPNGDLFAVGSFSSAGGVPVANAAIWNGTSWSSPGSGLGSSGTDAALLPNGNVAVVGNFHSAGGIANDGLAIWDGIAWSALPASGLFMFNTVAVDSNGDLLVGGDAARPYPKIKRWDGASWSGLPGVTATTVPEVRKLVACPNGDLMIVGTIMAGGQSANLAIYDGAQIQPLTAPAATVGAYSQAVVDANGGFLVSSQATGVPSTLVYRFDGVQWTPVGPPVGEISIGSILQLSSGAIAVGRQLSVAITSFESSVMTFSGGAWDAVGIAPAVSVHVTKALPNGDVVVGGVFSQMAGVAVNNIARWDGSTWHALAQGVDGRVTALNVAPDGSLLVAGEFLTAGGAPALRVARWSGSTWSTIGSGLTSNNARKIAQNDAGEVVVSAGGSHVHYFDGQAWSIPARPDGPAIDLLVMPSGEFLLLGSFVDVNQSPHVASGGLRLAGGTATIDTDFIGTSVLAGVFDPNGDLLVSTNTNGVNGIARVVGGVLQQLSIGAINGQANALDYLPNGDLLIAGSFTQAAQQPVGKILRWDGSTIGDVDGGVAVGSIASLAIGGHGDIFIAGDFLVAGGNVSIDVARARTSCPAAALSFGAGCTGSSGPVTLASDDMPWLGATWNATAGGMTAQSLAVHVVGDTSVAVPLPLGAAGCSLFVAPVLLELLVPQNGAAQVGFAIPAASVLIGNDLFSQVVGLELDASLSLLQTTSTNALQLTIGSF